jgi:hypothetical protein
LTCVSIETYPGAETPRIFSNGSRPIPKLEVFDNA